MRNKPAIAVPLKTDRISTFLVVFLIRLELNVSSPKLGRVFFISKYLEVLIELFPFLQTFN